MDLYDELGVPKDATPEEIKKAHRRGVKKHHPDAGGSPEKFGALQRAFETLSDEERRAHYDRTGDTGERSHQSRDAEIMQRVVLIISVILGADMDLAHSDISQVVKDHLANVRRQIIANRDARAVPAKKLARAEHLLKKFRRKKDVEDASILTQALESTVRQLEREIRDIDDKAEKELAMHERVEGVFAAYAYDFTEMPAPTAYYDPNGPSVKAYEIMDGMIQRHAPFGRF